MHGKGLLSSVLVVCLSSILLCIVCNWYLVIVINGRFPFVVTEEEAAMLRSFVDQPAFTDLHWVQFSQLS